MKNNIIGGYGNDILHATGDKTATMFGNTGDDSIIGADGNDVLNGGENNDTLYGNGGTDLLKGSEGDDEIYGGDNNDTIYGGNDTLTTGAGKNDLYGDAGNDYIAGGDSNDYIRGGADNDVLIGNAGNDYLIGDSGDDYLFDGEGTDWLIGGAGNDVYYMNYETDAMTIDFQGKSKNFGYITRDTIIDSDGQGSIVVGADTLTGGKSVDGSESVYKDDKNYTYTLSDSVLIISQGNFSFQVRDFSNGDLGMVA